MGTDWLRAAKVDVKFSKDYLKINDLAYKFQPITIAPKRQKIKKITFKAKNSVKIPPRSYKFIDIACNDILDKFCEIEPSFNYLTSII